MPLRGAAPPRGGGPGGAQADLTGVIVHRATGRGNGALPGIGLQAWVWRIAEDYLRTGDAVLAGRDDEHAATVAAASVLAVEALGGAA